MIGERYRSFFEAYFGLLPSVSTKGEVVISNPLRKDSTPSLNINLFTGKFKDFGSDLRGDAIGLYIEMHGVSFQKAEEELSNYLGGKPWVHPIDEAFIEQWHQELLIQLPQREYLTIQRGIPIGILQTYKIGWDGTRYTIPIRNEWGIYINVRKYSPSDTTGNKIVSYEEKSDGKKVTGWGTNALFPIDVLNANETIILHEGEWDTLIQLGQGFPALTTTGGAHSWKDEWTEKFRSKTVYICYDVDDAGDKGSQKIAAALAPVAKRVAIITLPLEGTKEDKDITDFYTKHPFTKDDFQKLLDEAVEFDPQKRVEVEGEVQKVSLLEARISKYKHQRVSFDVQVIGKDTAPYNIPYKGTYKCSSVNTNDKICSSCKILHEGGELRLDLPIGPTLLELIKTSKITQTTFLKSIANIPTGCKKYVFEETQSINMEEILIAPEIPAFHSWNGQPRGYLVQTAYFANRSIESNKSYRMQGIMTPDPWQQHVTFLLDTAEPLQDTIESFQITPEIREQLKIFQSEDVPGKFAEIHADLEANVTHIIGRSDLLTGIDLTYHSVLGFNFQDIPVQKGWVEFMCLGDTRTGKTETTEHILRHYQLGEISVAENTSYAGLVGGLQQTGDKRWFLTWGKLPLNDGRLFVIDEASGLSIDDIAKMSGIRSSGIAEITKIQTERTTARTRLIWLSNPRSGNALSTYSHGIQAAAELIGKAEDIARFDFIVSAGKDEVSISKINSVRHVTELPPHKYTSELCKQLILWVWSRKAADVIFSASAVQMILKYAIAMGERFSSQIPLVEGANQRIKLARLSIAVAARLFNTDADGERIIVNDCHVEFAYQYLMQIYSKPSLNYKGFSTGEYLDAQAAIKNRHQVLTFLSATPQLGELCARQDYLRAQTFEEQLNLGRQGASELISQFAKWRMLQDAGRKGYRKTAGFISILREWDIIRMEHELREDELKEEEV